MNRKYYVYDMGYENVNLDDIELPEKWRLDEDGYVVYEFDNVYEFTSSLFYNIDVAVEFGDWMDTESAYRSAVSDLFDCGSVVVNGFNYVIE